jgi:hypothetical protein
MWRYLAGGVAALLMAAAGMMLFGRGRDTAGMAARPLAQVSTVPNALAPDTPLPDTVPAASDRTREQKRFDRYDKDRDGAVARAEYLQPRRKAFAKLDLNHDGQLSFDEWAAKTEAKFATADADHNGSLTRPEFATTAVKHKAGPRHGPCPPQTGSAPAPAKDDDEGS